MLDSIYKTAQAILNKEQLGYLKPMDFNLFIRNAQRKVYDNYLTDLKSNVRRMNWMLDGKDFANLSEHTRQLLEYFSVPVDISKTTDFALPEDLEFVEDIFNGTVRIEKVHYSDYLDLQSNTYAPPSDCSPICAKVGIVLKVSPADITTISLHYLRKPKTPNWTYVEFQSKPMFDETANDYEDVDMPNSAYDELISLVVEMASISLRELNVTQAMNAEQQSDAQAENKQ